MDKKNQKQASPAVRHSSRAVDKSLKSILDRYYLEYDFAGRMLHDPIEFPHKYAKGPDIEVSGLIAACLAYGKVDLFRPVVGKILSSMGESPYEFVLSERPKKIRARLGGLKYRFNETDDIVCLIFLIGEALKRCGTLEKAFNSEARADVSGAVAGFGTLVSGIDTTGVYGKNIRPPGLMQFFPSPEKGSACKRMNMFLRWMVRDRDIDFGLWKSISKSSLVIPLDTHIARISRCLGFTARKSQDWKTAVEITEALKTLDPEDPLKYDFALCHHGISGICAGARKTDGCGGCVFGSR